MIKKLLLAIVLFFVLLIGALVTAVFLFGGDALNRIVKEVIERGGTYALGVDTTVDFVDLSLSASGQAAALSGLHIENPEGFAIPDFITLGNGSVSIEGNPLSQEVITIPDLTLTDIGMSLERSPDKANYQVIMDNLSRFESKDPSAPAPDDDQSAGMKFVVKTITLSDIAVTARLVGTDNATIEDATEIRLDINEIVLEDIGSAAEPVTAGEIVSIVVKTIIQTSIELGNGKLPEIMLAELGNKLAGLESLAEMGVQQIGEVTQEVAKQIEEVIPEGVIPEEITDTVEDVVNDGLDGLKGLIPGQDKEE
ncbi:MAG: hypothetical protein AAGB34_00965 [Planctomycetota bacterium]